MSWSDIVKGALGGFLGGHGGPPVNPNGFVPPPTPPTLGQNVGVPKPPGFSSGLASYAAPPIAPPPFMPSSQAAQFNIAGNLSGPVGSTVQPDQPKPGDDTPWYKSPAILNTIAGAGAAILQNRNEAANRAQQQQRIDLEKQQYADQHARQQATSQALDPIIARLLGQMMTQRSSGGHQ